MYRYEKFLRGVDRNIVIFDKDAKPGELTTHLFACMNQAARNIEGISSRLFKWHLPRVLIDEQIEKPTDKNYVEEYNRYIMGLEWEEQPEDLFCGIKVTNSNGLELHQNSWLVGGDKYYVIGETDNGEYVIGSC